MSQGGNDAMHEEPPALLGGSQAFTRELSAAAAEVGL
jgi:hypothetical protein